MASQADIQVPFGLPLVVLTLMIFWFSFRLAKEKSMATKVYVCWVLVSGVIHFFFEGGFAVFNASVTAETVKAVDHHTMSSYFITDNYVPLSSVLGAEYWRDMVAINGYALYGKFDFRYGQSDPVVVMIGWMEIFLHGPLSIWVAYEIIRDGSLKHLSNIVLTLVQIIGTIVYFFHPFFSREQLFTSNTWDLYVWVYFLNGIWILIPGIALIISARQVAVMSNLAEAALGTTNGKKHQ